MGKKVNQEDVIRDLFQDPRYIPDSRPLQRKLPNMPLMLSKPYPDSNPNALIQKGVSFLSTGEYTIDEQNNIYFKDPDTGKEIYLNKIDTNSYVHKMYARYILNDLSQTVNTVRQPNGKDTTVHARGGINLVHNSKVNVPADKGRITTESRGNISLKHTDRIDVNLNYQGTGVISNLYEIQSTFRHEYLHVRDNRKDEIGELEHAEEIYKEQMTYEEFTKAPVDFQRGIIKTYAKKVIKGCNPKEKADRARQMKSIQRRYFDAFNEGVGGRLGVSITYEKEKDWYFTIKKNGLSWGDVELFQKDDE